MSPIESRLEREAIRAAQRFRSGSYGPWEGEEAAVEARVGIAIRDLEEHCPSSGREDCDRAFRAALLSC